jgi:hypothetical protein
MKIDFRIVIIVIVALFVIEHKFFMNESVVEDVTLITEEKTGGVEKKVEAIVTDTIYIEVIKPGKALPERKILVVDSTYKAKYEEAIRDNDTLKSKNLFLESIALDKYKGTLIDNDEIKIDGEFTTRGKLLDYSIDYTIKSDTIRYTPEVRYRHPSLSLVYGIDAQLPTEGYKALPVIGAHVGLQFKSGSIFKLGVNSDKSITVGYSRTLKLFK